MEIGTMTANVRQKAKQDGKRSFIATGGILTMGESTKLAHNQIEEQNVTLSEGGIPRKTHVTYSVVECVNNFD
jgi:Zn/Cd-binding protein ZinT